jgi:hypothetical protein
MASELAIAGIGTGSEIVVVLRRDTDEQVWCATHAAFEAYDDAEAAAGNYDIDLSEQGSSGYFVGDFPIQITSSGRFNLSFYSKSGSDYTFVTAGTIDWSGQAEDASPSGLSWITRAQYKTMFTVTDDSLDDKIDMLIPMASVACNSYLDRTIKQTAYVAVLPGTGQNFLQLPNHPAASITSVTFGYLGNSPTVVDGSEFYVSPTGTMYFRPGSSQARTFHGSWIRVVYTAGHTAVPQDLQLACLYVLDSMVKLSDPDILVSEKAVKDVKVKYGAVITGDLSDPMFSTAKALLQPHKQLACI